jgi:hypothetical protein
VVGSRSSAIAVPSAETSSTRPFYAIVPLRAVEKEEVRREMEAAGYRLVNDYDIVARQHFQIFAKVDH